MTKNYFIFITEIKIKNIKKTWYWSATVRHATCDQQYPIPDLRQLLAVQLPLVCQYQTVGPCHSPHPATDEIMNLFSRAGTYHIAVNAIARFLQWGSGEMFCDAQERTKNVIFQVFQKKVCLVC